MEGARKKVMSSGGKKRPACRFGADCYQQNKRHRATYSHPDEESKAGIDDDSGQESKGSDQLTSGSGIE